MFITIDRKRWRVRRCPPLKDFDGDIDPPTAKNKEIRISHGLSDEDELETCIHEFWHGADWSKDEDWVEKRSKELTRFLLKMGWRKTKD